MPDAGNYYADGAWHHNSGKTSGLAADITRHCVQNAGAKAIVARQTESSQEDSTIDTFWQFFESLGNPMFTEAGGLFRAWNNGRTFRIPSFRAIQRFHQVKDNLHNRADIANWIKQEGDRLCSYIEFRGLPDAEKGKFRGMECSYMALVEADQIVRRQFELTFACLRWKGSDPETCDEKGFIEDRSIVLDTNPPSPSHWIAELEAEEMKKPDQDRRMRFWHIPTDENTHNLPPNYIEDQIMLPYANNPAMIQRMRYGQYADAFSDRAVYSSFKEGVHAGVDLAWPKGAYLIRSYDYGTHNAAVFFAYWKDERGTERLHALTEQYLENSDSDRQARGVVEITRDEFPFIDDPTICSGVQDYGDPSGANSNFSTKDTSSSVRIFQTHGIYPATGLWLRSIQMGVALINRLLDKRDEEGKPVFMVDKKNCPMLYRALCGGYAYPSRGEPGWGKDDPRKGPGPDGIDYSHICFIAGTRILTSDGEIPIESVKVGDEVMTRKGMRRVLKSFQSSESEDVWDLTSSEGTLTGTADHPIWIEGIGWKPLAKCSTGDRILVCRTKSPSTESRTRTTQKTNNHGGPDITSKEQSRCIGQYGNTTTDQSQQVTTSIIETETRLITTSQTLRRSPLASIKNSTGKIEPCETKSACTAVLIIKPEVYTQSDSVLKNAKLPQDENQKETSLPFSASDAHLTSQETNTNSEPECAKSASEKKGHPRSYQDSCLTTNHAENAGCYSPQRHSTQDTPFAQGSVLEHFGERQALITLSGNARDAESNSLPTKTKIESIVLDRAPQKRSTKHAVYNITVEGEHEYFANGILVSNCDPFRYACLSIMKILKVEHEKSTRPNRPRRMGNPNPNKRI